VKKNIKLNLLGFIFVCLCSCTPLKEVGTFTASSQKTLQSISIPYESYKYCQDSCYIFNDNLKNLKDVNCNCKPDSLRDTIIVNEIAILGSYYAGLTKLSGASMINFAPIGKTIKKGSYGKITITDHEASTFNSLSAVVTNLITLEYKTRKIKEIVSANDAAVQDALNILLLQIENLDGFIGTMESRYQTVFTTLIHDSVSESDKIVLVSIYKQKTGELDGARQHINDLEKSIKKILKGDQLLINNIDNLKDEGFKKSILSISGDIIYFNSKSN